MTKKNKGGGIQAVESYGMPGQGKSVKISIITSILIICAWWLVTSLGWIKPLFLPSPGEIIGKFNSIMSEEFSGGTLIEHFSISFYRIAVSFLLASLLAIPIGLLMGINRFARGIFDPPIEFYRPIPPLAYLPLTIIWLGIDDTQKIAVIFLAMFAPLVLSTRAGVKSCTIEQVHVAYSCGASKFQVVTQIILKAAIPEILTGMRIAIGFGWTTLVAAEMVAAEQGLGHMILSASEFLVTSVVVLGMIIIGTVAYLFDLFMRYLEKVLVPWKGKV